jgi:hypothetical protein
MPRHRLRGTGDRPWTAKITTQNLATFLGPQGGQKVKIGSQGTCKVAFLSSLGNKRERNSIIISGACAGISGDNAR